MKSTPVKLSAPLTIALIMSILSGLVSVAVAYSRETDTSHQRITALEVKETDTEHRLDRIESKIDKLYELISGHKPD